MLKPQDILVTLKFLTPDVEHRRSYAALAGSLQLSVAETHSSIQRVLRSRLLMAPNYGASKLSEFRPCPHPIQEVLCHGLPYFFPAQAGALVTGIPTAGDAPPLVSLLSATQTLPMVWAWTGGNVQGLAIEPLYSSAPAAALQDAKLAEWLALVDALRLGPGRMAELARSQIQKRLEFFRYAAAA